MVMIEKPFRELEEQLCPDSAFLIGDVEDFEEPILLLFYLEAA